MIGGIIYIVISLLPEFSVSMSINHYNVNYIALYLLTSLLSLSVLFILKGIDFRWGISYVGRYSIVYLCLHHIIYRPVKMVISLFVGATLESFLTLLATLIICTALIPILERYLPWAIGKSKIRVGN
jgi:hypothetical protein